MNSQSAGKSSDLVGMTPQRLHAELLSQEEIKAYLQGALHDGTFSQNHRYRISQKGTEWLEVLRKMFGRLGHRSWIYKEGKQREVHVIETLADFLDFSFDPLTLHDGNARAAYIRGFFDAEGGMPHHREARFYIQLCQKDKKKMRTLKLMLQNLGVACGEIHNPSKRVDPEYWRLYIAAASHRDFARIIGSWHPKKQKILEERKMI